MRHVHQIETRPRGTLLATLTALLAACGTDDRDADTASLGAALTADGAVLTQHVDAARTGWNPYETSLTWSNVPTAFGKLFTIPVAGRIFAQPLYAPQVVTANGTRDLLIVATEGDNVYAFDAHDGTQIWTRNLGTPIPSSEAYPTECTNIPDQIGITGTPVIDPATGTIYLVAATKIGTLKYEQDIHALDLATGAPRVSPRKITAMVPGDGFDQLIFDPLRENQRPGLLLLGNKVYVAWSSHCDDALHMPLQLFFGWVMSFDAATLAHRDVFNAARHKDPNNPGDPYGSSIWLGAGGIASDGSRLYVNTGNGLFDPADHDYGDSTLALDPSLNLVDTFTPSDQADLDAADLDFSAGGVVIVPDAVPNHPHLLVTTGKEGNIFVLDRDSLGGTQPAASAPGADVICPLGQAATGCVVAKKTRAVGSQDPNRDGPYFGLPAYFDGRLYFGGNGDVIKAFAFGGSQPLSDVVAHTDSATPYGYPGTTPSISSNHSADAIVWALERRKPGPFMFPDPTHLHAYRASDLSQLYSSATPGAPDTTGPDDPANAGQFITPTIAGGQVFIGTKDSVAVFGLHLTASPASQSIVQGASTTFTVSTAFASPATTTALAISGLPAGATATFAQAVVPSAGSTTLTIATAASTPPGTYPLTITGTKGGVAHSTVVMLEVTADQPPTAVISVFCEGRKCSFNGAGSSDAEGPIDGYTWDFGDGSGATTAVVTHLYAANGAYRVVLTVVDSRGQTGQAVKGVRAVDLPPHATFTVQCADRKCSVSAAQSYDDVGIASYQWGWGDGTASQGAHLVGTTHTYAAYGHYTITLTLTDTIGQRATTGIGVTLIQPPTATFTFTCAVRTCFFDASASYLPSGIAGYHWDFGDASSFDAGASPMVQHTFTAGGTYSVQLTIVDPGGNALSTTRPVAVP